MRSKPSSDELHLNAFLPYRLVRVADAISLKFSESYRQQYGLSRPEWRAVATLGEHNQLTATEISRLSTMHKTKVSRAVHALEKRGWLTRRSDPNDRRIEQLSLTHAGRSVYRELASLAIGFQSEIHELLGQQQTRAVEKALSRLEELIEDGTMPIK